MKLSYDERQERFWRAFQQLGDQLAEARAQLATVKEYKNVVLAKQMVIAQQDGVSSAAAQKRDALVSPEYKQALDAISAATEQRNKLEMRLNTMQQKIDVWRTQQSTKRAEMNLR